MSRRGRWILLVSLLVVCGSVAVLIWTREAEPIYKGKKLSAWLDVYEPPNEVEWKASREVVRQIGTNAIPCLLRWIAYEPPAWRERWRHVLSRFPQPVIRMLWNGDKLAGEACSGFNILGATAGSAVPGLVRLTKKPYGEEVRMRAMDALASIGKDGVAPLVAILESGPTPDRQEAASMILSMHELGRADVGVAVPGLLLLDRETRKYWDPNLGDGDHLYLLQLLGDQAFLVSALTNCLYHSTGMVRSEAVQVLWFLGKTETNGVALAGLMQAAFASDPSVRKEATNALLELAPERLKKAGP